MNFLATNTLNVLVGGTTAGVGAGNYSQITATALQLGGILNVAWSGGFTAVAGNVFTLLQATSITGGFSSMVLPTLGTGLGWRMQIVTAGAQQQFNLLVIHIPEPAMLSLFGGASLLLAGVRNRRRARARRLS
jgi:hypothetical protein